MAERELRTVTIGVSSTEGSKARLRSALRGDPQGHHISFATHELMLKTLTRKRWDILRELVGADPVSIRELARRVGRDVKAVHADVHALLDAGVLDRTADYLIAFPYDRIHVEYEVGAAA
ncbi:MAG: hypothetical protein JWN07_1494 [Hyphomicrobiales bacterium]|nr:hypothetical protein [Hyphomicrobiales bacterium]